MDVGPKGLDEFVAEVDRLGGPETPAAADYWRDFRYVPDYVVDTTLDPLSEAYVSEQVELWREIARRVLDQSTNEMTEFDGDRHLVAANPYANTDPSTFATHLLSLSQAIAAARLPRDAQVLDMGCGWGLSSEVLAYLGCTVQAVDINPSFAALVNGRAARLGLPIRAEVSSFEAFATEETFDMVFFYECLHHAVRPWVVIDQLSSFLRPGGAIVLAREPMQDLWWPHWGIRLDPLSVYCIRKFGWFESGWSERFAQLMFRRAGLEAVFSDDPGSGSKVCVARSRLSLSAEQPSLVVTARDLKTVVPATGWWKEQEHWAASGNATLQPTIPANTECLSLHLCNFRGTPVALDVQVDGRAPSSHTLAPGENVVDIGPAEVIELIGETWSPKHEHGTADDRQLSFHLHAVEFRL